jgi:hypothetical protein
MPQINGQSTHSDVVWHTYLLHRSECKTWLGTALLLRGNTSKTTWFTGAKLQHMVVLHTCRALRHRLLLRIFGHPTRMYKDRHGHSNRNSWRFELPARDQTQCEHPLCPWHFFSQRPTLRAAFRSPCWGRIPASCWGLFRRPVSTRASSEVEAVFNVNQAPSISSKNAGRDAIKCGCKTNTVWCHPPGKWFPVALIFYNNMSYYWNFGSTCSSE